MSAVDQARAALAEAMQSLALSYGALEQAEHTLADARRNARHAESMLVECYATYEQAVEEAGHLPPDAEPILKLPDGRLVRIDDDFTVHALGVLQPVTEVDA